MAPTYQALQDHCGLTMGDFVQIITCPTGGQLGWAVGRLSTSAQRRASGQLGHVYQITEDAQERGFRLDVSRHEPEAPDRLFPFFALKKVTEEDYILDSPHANG